MPSARVSTTTASSGPASCTTQSLGQKVVSRRNSVSTVTNGWVASRAQTSAKSRVVEIKFIAFL